MIRSTDYKRRQVIVHQLAELSKNGWDNARPCDYEPLEKELREIDNRAGEYNLVTMERIRAGK